MNPEEQPVPNLEKNHPRQNKVHHLKVKVQPGERHYAMIRKELPEVDHKVCHLQKVVRNEQNLDPIPKKYRKVNESHFPGKPPIKKLIDQPKLENLLQVK